MNASLFQRDMKNHNSYKEIKPSHKNPKKRSNPHRETKPLREIEIEENKDTQQQQRDQTQPSTQGYHKTIEANHRIATRTSQSEKAQKKKR